jgi:hypothetical protein
MTTRSFFSILGIALILASCGTSKQTVSPPANAGAAPTRQELTDEVRRKAIKDARDMADSYKKEGYRAFIGSLPIERQIEASLLREVETDAQGQPVYLAGNADITSGTSAAAQAQAFHQAKINLAAQINVRLAGMIKSSLGNEHHATLDKFLQASQEVISADLERVDKVVEIYRELPDKRYNVQTRVTYNTRQAIQAAEKRLLESLEKEAAELHKEVSDILNKQ